MNPKGSYRYTNNYKRYDISSGLFEYKKLSGTTDEEIAKIFKVDVSTIKRWLSGVEAHIQHIPKLKSLLRYRRSKIPKIKNSIPTKAEIKKAVKDYLHNGNKITKGGE